MRTGTKRAIAAASTLILFAGLQWVSGLPFERSEDEALFFVVGLFFAGWASMFPGFDA